MSEAKVPTLKSRNYPKDSNPDLVIYGHWISQPSRAVMWALLICKIPFTMVQVNPLKRETQSPEILKLNPLGKVPILVDKSVSTPTGPLVITDSGAIFEYLAEKYPLGTWFPTDLVGKTKAREYLHFHHDFTRQFTMKLFFFRSFGSLMGMSEEDIAKKMKQGAKGIRQWLHILESKLAASKFIISDTPTVCDLQAYAEIGQVVPKPHGAGVFDFTKYPNILRWAADIRALPCYDEAHQASQALLSRL